MMYGVTRGANMQKNSMLPFVPDWSGLRRMLFMAIFIALAICLVQESSAKQNVLAKQTTSGQDLFSVSFPTEKDGWACGRWGTIVHSQDGGQTWEPQQSGTELQLNSISFADQKNGWAVGDGGVIIHTSDGGTTWQKQSSPVALILLAVHFANNRKGWAVGEKTHILYTEDGGKSWRIQFKQEDWTLHSISFYDENTGWVSGEYGYIYGTTNGGATWQKQAGKFGFDDDTGETVFENYLFAITAMNVRAAIAVGIDGTVTATSDGGATWQKVKTDIPSIHLWGVASREGRLFITSRGVIITGSASGGNFTRAKLEPPIPYGYMYGISPRGRAGFVAVGKKGQIYLSDAAGISWKIVQTTTKRADR
jgi:photosystem II stability/assembly factor-like uncharacterized protein